MTAFSLRLVSEVAKQTKVRVSALELAQHLSQTAGLSREVDHLT
jgi:hypothetical protein